MAKNRPKQNRGHSLGNRVYQHSVQRRSEPFKGGLKLGWFLVVPFVVVFLGIWLVEFLDKHWTTWTLLWNLLLIQATSLAFYKVWKHKKQEESLRGEYRELLKKYETLSEILGKRDPKTIVVPPPNVSHHHQESPGTPQDPVQGSPHTYRTPPPEPGTSMVDNEDTPFWTRESQDSDDRIWVGPMSDQYFDGLGNLRKDLPKDVLRKWYIRREEWANQMKHNGKSYRAEDIFPDAEFEDVRE